MSESKKQTDFNTALEDHSAEGLEIITAKPLLRASALIYVLAALILFLIVWSFYGKMEVVVSVKGFLEPSQGVRHVYAPIKGSLYRVHVSSGMKVNKGDLLARIKIQDAINWAAQEIKARLELEAIEDEQKRLPLTMQLLQAEVVDLKMNIEQTERRSEDFEKNKLPMVKAKQEMELEQSELRLIEAEKKRKHALNALEKCKQMLTTRDQKNSIPKSCVDKNRHLVKAESMYQQVLSAHRTLKSKNDLAIDKLQQTLRQMKIKLYRYHLQLAEKEQQYANLPDQIQKRIRVFHALWKKASKIKLEDIDPNDCLDLCAPISGVVTDVRFSKIGDRVQAGMPIVSIAPKNARMSLIVDIPATERGLIGSGKPVKIKFSAFPHHRFGFIPGRLTTIYPPTAPFKMGRAFYKGHIILERDYFVVNGQKKHLWFGMPAIADIFIKKRRFIEMALFPFQKGEVYD